MVDSMFHANFIEIEFASRKILFAQSLKVPQIVLLPQLALIVEVRMSSYVMRMRRSPVKIKRQYVCRKHVGSMTRQQQVVVLAVSRSCYYSVQAWLRRTIYKALGKMRTYQQSKGSAKTKNFSVVTRELDHKAAEGLLDRSCWTGPVLKHPLDMMDLC